MGQAGDYHLSVSRRLYSLESSLQAVSPARSARQGRKPQLQSVKLVPSVKRSQSLPPYFTINAAAWLVTQPKPFITVTV
jgi:hypothetical protein